MKTIHPHALAIFLFTLVLTLLAAATASAASSSSAAKAAAATSFVKSVCNSTAYPDICNKVCLPYAPKIKDDYKRMGYYALKGSMEASKKASKTVSKLSKDKKLNASESLAIKDCIDENKDTISEIRDSLRQMGGDSSDDDQYGDIKSKVFDVKTWISAAITDLDTCLNGLDEEDVRPDVKAKITNAVRYVSILCTNSLTIIGLIQY